MLIAQPPVSSSHFLSVFFLLATFKASIPLWRTTKSPRDSNSRLWCPQAELPPFTSSPGKHLTLLVHCHRMGATTRHQCYLLSIQSSNQLCGKEEQLRRKAVSWQNKFIKIDETLNLVCRHRKRQSGQYTLFIFHFQARISFGTPLPGIHYALIDPKHAAHAKQGI